MTAILKIDDLDLYAYVRFAEGDGFTPTAGDKINPDFTQSGLAEGQPLVDINEDNGEFVIPVHLNARDGDFTDTFASNTIGTTWTLSSGTGLSISGGQLVPASTGLKLLMAFGQAAFYEPILVLKYTTDNPLTTNNTGVILKYVDANNYLFTRTGVDIVEIFKVEGGVTSSALASAATSALAVSTSYWTRGYLKNSVVTVEHWTTDPALGGTAATTASYTLTTDEQELFGAGIATRVGIRVNPGSTSYRYDDFDAVDRFIGRQGLADMEKDLNRRLDAAQFVEWRDDGLDYSTFYRVAYARWEPEYRYFRAQAKYMTGIIRVWTKPYGQAATAVGSLMASRTQGSSPYATLPIPTQMGDVDSLVRTNSVFGAMTAGVSSYGFTFGLSILPNASYRPVTPAASFVAVGNAVLVGGSGAAGSQYYIASAPVNAMATTAWYIVAPRLSVDLMPGDNRVLAWVRSRTAHGIGVRAFTTYGSVDAPIGPTAVATLPEWQLIDLGVARVPTRLASITGGGFPIYLRYGGLASGALGASQPVPATSGVGSGGVVHINQVITVPENDTIIVSHPTLTQPLPSAMFDDVEKQGVWLMDLSVALRDEDISSLARGVIPTIDPGAPRTAFIFWDAPGVSNLPQSAGYNSISTTERFRFAR